MTIFESAAVAIAKSKSVVYGVEVQTNSEETDVKTATDTAIARATASVELWTIGKVDSTVRAVQDAVAKAGALPHKSPGCRQLPPPPAAAYLSQPT